MALFSKEPVDPFNPTAEEALNGMRDATMLLLLTRGLVDADQRIDGITRAGLNAALEGLKVYVAWAGIALTNIVEQAWVNGDGDVASTATGTYVPTPEPQAIEFDSLEDFTTWLAGNWSMPGGPESEA